MQILLRLDEPIGSGKPVIGVRFKCNNENEYIGLQADTPSEEEGHDSFEFSMHCTNSGRNQIEVRIQRLSARSVQTHKQA